jgi:hypothetical protein
LLLQALAYQVRCAQDTTFEMERRRNRPEKYNREVVQQTVKAMEKIAEVQILLLLQGLAQLRAMMT